ncbi:ureidoglycolate lyase [Methylobacterium sp. R2-1]|uniref:ureidoglycolate lyase n=1 Tax=Methylobacterium sp. R2-1 TaxID=2587064 RepID=UPI001612DA71|nr:ureidoglycolate lyase [Methylobacterium sp. R2-1]MBB2960338.1 ureidoglycolate lyase [Methylobacterium sp. R2-1]
MGDRTVIAQPLTGDAFAPFGEVIGRDGIKPRPMNGDRASRYHALATAEIVGEGAGVAVSLVDSQPVSLPLALDLVERHPLGSQAFVPLAPERFLVVVCPDVDGRPGPPLAFITAPGQGVNYRAGTWHGVLAPLRVPQSFVVVDREGPGINLEEVFFDQPWRVEISPGAV